MIILNHDENHKETDLKLSRYFNKVLSVTKITQGLKQNLKSIDLFEALNDFYLQKEKYINYYNPDDISLYCFSESNDEVINNKARSSK